MKAFRKLKVWEKSHQLVLDKKPISDRAWEALKTKSFQLTKQSVAIKQLPKSIDCSTIRQTGWKIRQLTDNSQARRYRFGDTFVL